MSTPDFTKYTNYKNNAGVSSVVFGANSTILEVELNEMQEIQNYALRNFIKTVIGNGITDASKMIYDKDMFYILGGCSIACDGYLINIPETGTLGIGHKDGLNGKTIYLYLTETILSHDNNLKKDGYVMGEIVENWMKDPRASNETSKRKVVNYDLSTVDGYSPISIPIARIENNSVIKLINEINLSNLAGYITKVGQQVGDLIFGVEDGILYVETPDE